MKQYRTITLTATEQVEGRPPFPHIDWTEDAIYSWLAIAGFKTTVGCFEEIIVKHRDHDGNLHFSQRIL